ncbi:hypothetical protein [Kineococcus esterisolvens]|uniref:hypothetical protein n=1 Tax=Kineococcus sp. SYSU DK009 TaxID=3383130 RepID=UPI003D7D9C72
MDPQSALPAQLVRLAQEESFSPQRVLDAVHAALAPRTGVRRAEVLAHERGRLVVVARAGEAGPVPGACATFTLRHGGAELGLLHLHGGDPSTVDRAVGAAAGHHLAVALRDVTTAREQAELHRVTDAVRRLFEEGVRAVSVEAAGRLLVAVAADVLGTERAAVMLVAPDTRVTHVLGVGLPEELEQRLAASLLGRLARDSPAWQRAALTGGPDVVDDVGATGEGGALPGRRVAGQAPQQARRQALLQLLGQPDAEDVGDAGVGGHEHHGGALGAQDVGGDGDEEAPGGLHADRPHALLEQAAHRVGDPVQLGLLAGGGHVAQRHGEVVAGRGTHGPVHGGRVAAVQVQQAQLGTAVPQRERRAGAGHGTGLTGPGDDHEAAPLVGEHLGAAHPRPRRQGGVHGVQHALRGKALLLRQSHQLRREGALRVHLGCASARRARVRDPRPARRPQPRHPVHIGARGSALEGTGVRTGGRHRRGGGRRCRGGPVRHAWPRGWRRYR